MKQKITQKEDTLPEEIHVNQEMLELEIQDHKITHLRCGEWAWSGWCWSISGNNCDGEFMTFMTRVLFAKKESRDEFLASLKQNGMTFKQVAQQCIEDIESYDDSLYSLTGDSGRWHFGDSPFDHITYDNQISWYVEESKELTDIELKIAMEYVWMEMPVISYEGFMEYEFGSDIKKMTIDALQESENFEEFQSTLEDIRYTIEEDYSSYCDETFRIGMSDTIALLRSGKYNQRNLGLA